MCFNPPQELQERRLVETPCRRSWRRTGADGEGATVGRTGWWMWLHCSLFSLSCHIILSSFFVFSVMDYDLKMLILHDFATRSCFKACHPNIFCNAVPRQSTEVPLNCKCPAGLLQPHYLDSCRTEKVLRTYTTEFVRMCVCVIALAAVFLCAFLLRKGQNKILFAQSNV